MKKYILLFLFYLLIVGVKAQDCDTGVVSADTTICSGFVPGELTIVDFESGADLQWQESADNSTFTDILGITTASFSPGVLTSTTYYRVGVNSGDCTLEFSGVIIVTVHQAPTAPTGVTGAENTICNGTSITLVADGGVEGTGADYVWGSGTVVGVNTLDTTDNSSWATPTLTESTNFWVRRIASTSSTCTTTTTGVSQLVSVRPALIVSITSPVELCQLPGQLVEITNGTDGEAPLQIQWASAAGQSGSITLTTTAEVELDLSLGTESSNFNILSYGFTNMPGCTVNTVITEEFDIKPRPSITTVSHTDLTLSDNALCQSYGPVEFNVSTPNDIEWVSSYFINEQLNTAGLNVSPFNLEVDSAGNHEFIVDSLWYSTGLSCGYNPADYEVVNYYSHSVAIKPTPPAVGFVAGAPSILQFCNYSAPLVIDSVSRVNDLNIWIENEEGYAIEWKDSDDNSAVSLNNIPLENGGSYFPVYELDGCHTKLNSSSESFIVDLMPLPDLLQSDFDFPESVCSGTPFDMLFNPAENISHFAILDFEFDPPLSSPNITDATSYNNIQGLSFSITNSSETDADWAANVFAQNKNVSEINPVTCWAAPVTIQISVNPNATFNPSVSSFESCQNGSNLIINPGWNGIGEASWDDPLGLPAAFSIDESTKILNVDLSAQTVPPGIYSIGISGGYLNSGCEVDTSFTITIHNSPEVETRILDIDETICHNEYTNIEVINPNSDFNYEWSCTNCDTDPKFGLTFLPHWSNPEPASGTWNDKPATYTIKVVDATTAEMCASENVISVNVLADNASCPEGIDFFLPNGLSVVDAPALYFQWYDVEAAAVFSKIEGATDQTFFPEDALEGCDTSKYIVTTSLYADRCWSTTLNCFEQFGLRECHIPKSKSDTPKFLVYPNPIIGNNLILENLSKDLEGRYALDFIDLTGKKLMSEIIQIEAVGQNKVVLPTVEKGVYLLRVSNNRYSQTFKIIFN